MGGLWHAAGRHRLDFVGEDTEATAQAIVDVITGERDENCFCDLVRPQVR